MTPTSAQSCARGRPRRRRAVLGEGRRRPVLGRGPPAAGAQTSAVDNRVVASVSTRTIPPRVETVIRLTGSEAVTA